MTSIIVTITITVLQLYLLAGGDDGGGLQEVVVLALQVALERHLGVGVEVGVSDAGPGDSRHKTRLGLAGQVGFLLDCGEIHVAGGVEPGERNNRSSLKTL